MIEIKMTEDHECMINLSGRGGNIMEELAIAVNKACTIMANETDEDFEKVLRNVYKISKLHHLRDKVITEEKQSPSEIISVLLDAIHELDKIKNNH
nr:MAG TPA: hypothetical protein [Caudoviricetes sp.]